MSTIDVQISFALPAETTLIDLSVAPETTVIEAIQRSGILTRHPEIDLTKNKVGVFGKLLKLDSTLHDRDRIEIYRPLLADPKEIRRQRAAEGKVMRKGGGEA
ncbi:MAG: RnfH family protein [Betaproteobacteria bacterium]|nr:RnfH family protein [Betaproteobacteria bacterium]